MISDKQLIVFDFDNTIVDGFSDFPVIDLIKDKSRRAEILAKYGKLTWLDVMQEVFLELKKMNIKIDRVKEAVESIKLNQGFDELLDFVNHNQDTYDSMIVSGANTLIIKWIIERYQKNIKLYALPCQLENDLFLKIDKMHDHNCDICSFEQCKKKVIIDHLAAINKTYRKIIFIGDGHNDFCPAIWLNENDYVFPREDFVLHKMIKQTPQKIKGKIFPWKGGKDIMRFLQRIR